MTGSELVRGDRNDLNGPFYAREAVVLGLEPARISIVGDRADELEDAIREGLRAEICLISGGLGPTHDDRTVQLVAKCTGRALIVDPALEAEIESVSRRAAERLGRPYADFASGVTKQATVPEGAITLGLAGTAPGLVIDTGSCVAVVLPGPPAELQRLWPRALESEPVRRLLERAEPPQRTVLRFFGLSESAVAQALADAGGDGDGVEATICARDFEIHVDLLADPGGEARAAAVADGLRGPLAQWLFGEDERPIEELVLGLCRERGLTLATAESCTGGMVSARLTAVVGSSDVYLGGIVSYGNEVKEQQLGVTAATIEKYGAVSAEVAVAMARGAQERLGADIAVAVTGVAGPDGGTVDKPVGLVHLHAEGPHAGRSVSFELPGDRATIRARSTVAALHLVRRVLTQSRDKAV